MFGTTYVSPWGCPRELHSVHEENNLVVLMVMVENKTLLVHPQLVASPRHLSYTHVGPHGASGRPYNAKHGRTGPDARKRGYRVMDPLCRPLPAPSPPLPRARPRPRHATATTLPPPPAPSPLIGRGRRSPSAAAGGGGPPRQNPLSHTHAYSACRPLPVTRRAGCPPLSVFGRQRHRRGGGHPTTLHAPPELRGCNYCVKNIA